jgi:hypothetical protein
VLIDENRVSIWINNHKASRASRLSPASEIMFTPLSNVRKFSELLSIAAPARVEGENVLIEHTLKQPNSVVAVLHDQPTPGLLSCETVKPSFS